MPKGIDCECIDNHNDDSNDDDNNNNDNDDDNNNNDDDDNNTDDDDSADDDSDGDGIYDCSCSATVTYDKFVIEHASARLKGKFRHLKYLKFDSCKMKN